MKFSLPLAVSLSVSALLLAGCNNDKVSVGGVPAWIAAGAEIEEEPEPYEPDPAVIHFETENAPLEWTITTDKRKYEKPRVKPEKKPGLEPDPIERGRVYRIKRLVR